MSSQCVPACVCSHPSLWVLLGLIEIIWEELLGCMVFLLLSFSFSCFHSSQKTPRKEEIEDSSCFLPCSQNSQCGSSGLIWRDCLFFPINEGVEVMQDRKLLFLSYLTTQKFHWCSSSELSEFPPAFW